MIKGQNARPFQGPAKTCRASPQGAKVGSLTISFTFQESDALS